MTFTPGYVRHKRTYSFRAYVDERGSNMDRRPEGALKLWDLNWRGTSHNIIRVIRGKRHFVVLIGKNYRRFGWPGR